MRLPGTIHQGDSLRFTAELPDYPAPAWTLRYALFNADHVYHIDTSAAGQNHQVDLASVPWAPGRYDWTAYVQGPGQRHVIADGKIRVLPDPALTTPQDRRSHARKVLDAIEAVLEARASADQLDLVRSVMGTGLSRYEAERATGELLALRDKYRAEVAREERAEALARGDRLPNKILVRL